MGSRHPLAMRECEVSASGATCWGPRGRAGTFNGEGKKLCSCTSTWTRSCKRCPRVLPEAFPEVERQNVVITFRSSQSHGPYGHCLTPMLLRTPCFTNNKATRTWKPQADEAAVQVRRLLRSNPMLRCAGGNADVTAHPAQNLVTKPCLDGTAVPT